jgi:hypothetical protein
MKLIHSLKKNSKRNEGGSMSAAGAHAVEFQFMRLNGEAVSASDLFLELFDIFILEFYDLAAARADEVIVVPLVRHVIVLGLRAEVAGLGQSHLAKEVERPVDRGQTNMRVFFSELPIHLLCGDVFIFQEHVKNMFALSRELQLMLGQMIFEDRDFFCGFRHDALR